MSSSSAVKANAHGRSLTVAVEGCLHGELDKVYATIAEAELHGGKKVDLLIGKRVRYNMLRCESFLSLTTTYNLLLQFAATFNALGMVQISRLSPCLRSIDKWCAYTHTAFTETYF
jgi:hypothetical protein